MPISTNPAEIFSLSNLKHETDKGNSPLLALGEVEEDTDEVKTGYHVDVGMEYTQRKFGDEHVLPTNKSNPHDSKKRVLRLLPLWLSVIKLSKP